jgi:hypothetical protein
LTDISADMTDKPLPDEATLSSMARAAAATGVSLEQILAEEGFVMPDKPDEIQTGTDYIAAAYAAIGNPPRSAVMSDNIEHEIQRQMLARLGIEWTPGEPFYALIEDEIVRLRRDLQTDALHPLVNEALQQYQAENERLRQHDKEATDLTIDQQVEIGRLRAANQALLGEAKNLLALHHQHLTSGHCDYCGEVPGAGARS